MGTNFYARIIPTKKRKEELIDLISTSNDFSQIMEEINRTYGKILYDYSKETYTGGEVHLGKRSGGWKFLWNPNQYKICKGHIEHYKDEDGKDKTRYVEDPYEVFNFYDLTKESIKKFIDREDVEIYDEYGVLQEDKEEFFNMAVNWVTWKTPEGEVEAWDGVSYAKWQKENGEHYIKHSKTDYCYFLEEIGYKMTEEYTDFFSDGLRFATCTDFS